VPVYRIRGRLSGVLHVVGAGKSCGLYPAGGAGGARPDDEFEVRIIFSGSRSSGVPSRMSSRASVARRPISSRGCRMVVRGGVKCRAMAMSSRCRAELCLSQPRFRVRPLRRRLRHGPAAGSGTRRERRGRCGLDRPRRRRPKAWLQKFGPHRRRARQGHRGARVRMPARTAGRTSATGCCHGRICWRLRESRRPRRYFIVEHDNPSDIDRFASRSIEAIRNFGA
jgi:hypothetical protein